MQREFNSLMKSHRYSSNDELGKRVLEEWKKKHPKSEGDMPKERAMGVYIGKLRKGDVGWWCNHSEAASILAELLEVSTADLGIDRSLERERKHWPYSEFSELPAFDPTIEVPCELGALVVQGHPQQASEIDFWALHTTTKPNRCVWIQMPPKVGKGFSLHWHKARNPEVSTFSIKTLHEARNKLSSRDFLLFSVERSDSSDAEVLEKMEKRGRVAVLANFLRPTAKHLQNDPQREASSRTSAENEREDDKAPPTRGQSDEATSSVWHDLLWEFYSDWQERWVRWVAERMDKATFEPEDVLSWIRREDPTGTLFQIPGDVLPLLAFAHSQKARNLDNVEAWDFASAWVERMLLVYAKGDENRDHWLRANGLKAIKALIEGRWKDVSLPWEGSLPQDVWIRFFPQDRYAVPEKKDLNGSGTTSWTSSPELSMEYLRKIQFLVSDTQNQFATHSWLAVWLARPVIEEALKVSAPEVWGRWYVDPHRRVQVEVVLDLLPNEKLEALIKQTVEVFDPAVLGIVGAIEALFAAVGRRLQKEQENRNRKQKRWQVPFPELYGLWKAQTHLLFSRGEHGDARTSPLTRDDRFDASWLADCWSWSLSIPAPQDVPVALVTLFPCWFPQFLSNLKREQLSPLLHFVQNYPSPPQRWKDADLRAMRLFSRILENNNGRVLPKDDFLRTWLTPHLLLSSKRDEWEIGCHAGILLNSSSSAKFFVEESKKLSEPQKRSAAACLMRNLLENRPFDEVFGSLLRHPELRQFVIDFLPKHVWMDLLVKFYPSDFPLFFRYVPREFWPEVIRYCTRHPEGSFALIHIEIIPRLELAEAGVLWELAGKREWISGEVVQRLWQLVPEEAFIQTQKHLHETPHGLSFRFWCSYSPARYYTAILDALRGQKELSSIRWLEGWLARILSEEPTLADQIYPLLYRVRFEEGRSHTKPDSEA